MLLWFGCDAMPPALFVCFCAGYELAVPHACVRLARPAHSLPARLLCKAHSCKSAPWYLSTFWLLGGRAICALPGLFLFTLYAAVVWASKAAITVLLLLVGFCFLPPGNVRRPVVSVHLSNVLLVFPYEKLVCFCEAVAGLPAF